MSAMGGATTVSPGTPKQWEVYVYGTIAVMMISGASFVGAMIIPFMKRKWFQQAMIFFIALAIGTMAADSLLHLVPETLELNMAAELLTPALYETYNATNQLFNAEPVSTIEPISNIRRLERLLVALVTIYCFHLFDSVTKLYSLRIRAVKKNSTHASNGILPSAKGAEPVVQDTVAQKTDKVFPNSTPGQPEISLPDKEKNTDPDAPQYTIIRLDAGDESAKDTQADPEADLPIQFHHSHGQDAIAESLGNKTILGMKPVVFMIIFGGALHNFADGLALGASFASSLTLGLSTTIALVCHEIPHELGDFAVLINTGLTVKRALFLNGLSAVPAIVGLYIAIGLSTLTGVLPWIFAVVLGTFIYISLIAMMGELREIEPERSYAGFYLSNGGLIVGATILILIAFFEDLIDIQ